MDVRVDKAWEKELDGRTATACDALGRRRRGCRRRIENGRFRSAPAQPRKNLVHPVGAVYIGLDGDDFARGARDVDGCIVQVSEGIVALGIDKSAEVNLVGRWGRRIDAGVGSGSSAVHGVLFCPLDI